MQTTTYLDQPLPKHNDRPACWPEVIKDMQERHQVGIARYGTPLQPHNGRDAIADAYAEALDYIVYLKQALMERDAVRELMAALKPFADLITELEQRGDMAASGRTLVRVGDLQEARKVFVSFGGVFELPEKAHG